MRSTTSNALTKFFALSKPLNLVAFYFSKITSYEPIMPRRFTLGNGEVFRIPQIYQEFQVLSGIAWLTIGGRDLILHSGEKIEFQSKKDVVIISPLGKTRLMVEVT
jgi:hypothetical protein